MSNKRERKPRTPKTDPLKVFNDIEETLEAREEHPEALEIQTKTPDDIFGSQGKSSSASPDPPESTASPGTVDEYIRQKVLMEMYGTETPSDYDKISLALRKYL